jgi:hypothetical protein
MADLRDPVAPRLARVVALLSLAAAAARPAGPAAAARYAQGEAVEVTGVVTGRDGVPIAGVQVTFEAARMAFDLRRLSPTARDTTRVTATTDERGAYRLSWPWNSYYNRFELVVGMAVRKPGGERVHELARLDLTRQLRKGSPVVVTPVVEDAAFVANLRRFLAGVDSDDERRVYGEMGKPDKIEERVFAGGSGRVDATWWYFEAGRAYRFEDGALAGVDRFDPVKGF